MMISAEYQRPPCDPRSHTAPSDAADRAGHHRPTLHSGQYLQDGISIEYPSRRRCGYYCQSPHLTSATRCIQDDLLRVLCGRFRGSDNAEISHQDERARIECDRRPGLRSALNKKSYQFRAAPLEPIAFAAHRPPHGSRIVASSLKVVKPCAYTEGTPEISVFISAFGRPEGGQCHPPGGRAALGPIDGQSTKIRAEKLSLAPARCEL
jgi:hypothetical protein